MEFIKENWFKLSALLVLIVFGFYYFSIHQPKQYTREMDLYCREAGEEYYERAMEEIKLYFEETFRYLEEYKYFYSEKKDTCLLYYKVHSYSDFLETGYSVNVIDLKTNNTLYKESCFRKSDEDDYSVISSCLRNVNRNLRDYGFPGFEPEEKKEIKWDAPGDIEWE